MATHSSILSWEIQWTVEPGGLQSMGSHRVGHDCVTKKQVYQKNDFKKGRREAGERSEYVVVQKNINVIME